MAKIQLSRQRLSQHIHELAAAFKVVLVIDPNMPVERSHNLASMAADGTVLRNEVVIPPVTCEVTYAAALHELGHACHPNGQLRGATDPRKGSNTQNGNLQLDEEDAAWEWARYQALVWTVKMEETRRVAYESHVQTVRMRQTYDKFIARPDSIVGKRVKIDPTRPPQSLADFLKKIL